MIGGLDSILPSVAFLGVLVGVAIALSVRRDWGPSGEIPLRSAVRASALALVAQTAHFSEELVTGFHDRFPELFGLGPMPLGFFVGFNVFWIAVWGLAVWGLAHRQRAALFPLWFLGLGCVANGLAHPGLSLITGGYFPGLVSSPVAGVLGLVLLRSLVQVTRPQRDPESPWSRGGRA